VHVGTLRGRPGDHPELPRFIHTVRGVGFRFSSAEEPADSGRWGRAGVRVGRASIGTPADRPAAECPATSWQGRIRTAAKRRRAEWRGR
jgi:hypothetical protein